MNFDSDQLSSRDSSKKIQPEDEIIVPIEIPGDQDGTQLGSTGPDVHSHSEGSEENSESGHDGLGHDDSLVVNTGPPTLIGRYEIVAQLGKGGFGFVYEGFDPKLRRRVAVKVPRWDRPLNQKELTRFCEEGETLAKIKHPSIVQVFDVGETEDGIPFVVMEFVEGETLAQIIKREATHFESSIRYLLKIAEALREAHKASVIHRDLKPANVIVDSNGQIRLVDFGLALHDDLSIRDLGGAIVGTPSYMSPEQIRGENHRIDGQTDIWAFGVTMYRMLTKRHPFRGKTTEDLARAIRYKAAKPLRQLDETIPKEFERICLRCMSKSMMDRYQSMQDLIDDLEQATIEHFEKHNPSSSGRSALVGSATTRHLKRFHDSRSTDTAPHDSSRAGKSDGSVESHSNHSHSTQPIFISYKGLRPFESSDKDFFLGLLPGLKDKDGVPDSVRFWQRRINGHDELEPLTVGVLYGPSGCGKSSFVRAGLIPLLPSRAMPIYLECSSENTEKRLARQIAHKINSVNPDDSLSDIFRQFRRGEHLEEGDKLVVFLDQFEQWLHAADTSEHQELIDALGQSDGEHIVILLMVRDDFWMSTSQLMKSLEIPIREGQNALAMPLFDERHARRVLMAYGRAFGRLPDTLSKRNKNGLSRQQNSFVKEAIKSLSRDGKVICVHLSVFAQIAKDREWTAAELHKLGGLKGVGVRFLDDIFPETIGSNSNKKSIELAKLILRKLVDTSTTIKGDATTVSALRNVCTSQNSLPLFEGVFDRMESELKLISFVEHSIRDEESEQPDAVRLTHDFMINPIREWLSKKDKETWQGRAQLRLSSLSEQWDSNERNKRYLPGLLEANKLVFGVRASTLSLAERAYYHAALRNYGVKLLALVAMMVFATIAALTIANNRKRNDVIQLLDDVVTTKAESVPNVLDQILVLRRTARPIVSQLSLDNSKPHDNYRISLVKAMLDIDSPSNAKYLANRIADCDPVESRNVIAALAFLRQHGEDIESLLMEGEKNEQNLTVKARLAIALLSLEYPNSFNIVVENNSSIEFKSILVSEIATVNGDISNCVRGLRQLDVEYINVIFCKGFANANPNKLSANDRNLVIAWLEKQTADFTTAGLFVAAQHAHKRWKVNASMEPDFRGPDKPTPAIKQIEFGGNELSFVLVQAGEVPLGQGISPMKFEQITDRNTLVDHDFYVSSKEVSAKLFYLFLENAECPVETKTYFRDHILREHLDFDLPICNVTRSEAAIFCNWLSDQFSLARRYEESKGDWIPVEGANGFRLPTVLEWELACRAGNDSTYSFGSDQVVNLFREYFWGPNELFPVTGLYVGSRGAKLPNDYGLYDMLGNAAEWMENNFGDLANGPKQYCIRGGHSSDSNNLLRCGSFIYNPPHRRSQFTGIRLVIDNVNAIVPAKD